MRPDRFREVLSLQVDIAPALHQIAAGRDFQVQVLWNGPSVETDFSRQIQIVDSMIARNVDGSAVSASDRTALNGALERAARARIPVTVFDSGVESTNYMTFLATNNPGAGEMAARKLAELVRARGKVAMLMHVPGSVSTMDREIRFEEVIQQQHPGMRIVARQYGMSDRSRAASAAENILGVHPDLAGFFASSEASPVGAALALKARGLSGRVKLVGFDSTEGMLEDMRAGAIDALAGETRDPGIALPGSEKTSEPPLNDD